MDFAKKEFKAVFKEPMEALGFTYAGNCFYRQINDVLQTLTLSATKWNFSFQHLITPLCIPLSRVLPSGHLGPTEKEKRDPLFGKLPPSFVRRDIAPIPFVRKYNKKNIRARMYEGFECVVNESVPFFEKGTNTKSAYDAVIADQRKICRFDAGYILHDNTLKWMALVNRDYDCAYMHQAAMICQNMGLFSPNITEKVILSPAIRKQWETYSDNDPPHLKESRDFLWRIINKDDAYFAKLIEERTKITLNFLAKVDKSPCKYGSCRY